jgi:hypothetical protein
MHDPSAQDASLLIRRISFELLNYDSSAAHSYVADPGLQEEQEEEQQQEEQIPEPVELVQQVPDANAVDVMTTKTPVKQVAKPI